MDQRLGGGRVCDNGLSYFLLIFCCRGRAVVTTILGGDGLARLLGLSRTFGVLSVGSVAICGASAALTIASVVPRVEEACALLENLGVEFVRRPNEGSLKGMSPQASRRCTTL